MPRCARVFTRLAATGLAAGCGLLIAAPAVAAAGTAAAGQRVTELDARATARTDGSLRVVESITFDFAGAADRHGIVRVLPTAARVDDRRDRVYRVSDVDVTSPTGAPSEVSESTGDGTLTIRVGDPDRTVGGTQVYRLAYVLHDVADDGAGTVTTSGAASGQRVAWNAVGTGWTVPVEHADASLTGPAAAVTDGCRAGTAGASGPCASVALVSGTVTAGAGPLGPGRGMTLVAGYPGGTFPARPAELRRVWRPGVALRVGPVRTAAAVATALGVLALGLLATRPVLLGRSARRRGPGAGRDRSRARPAGAPEPPGGAQPAELAALLTDRVTAAAALGTLFDLGARGHLVVREIDGAEGEPDWEIAAGAAPAAGLTPWERALLDSVLPDQRPVRLSADPMVVHEASWDMRTALVAALVARGWWRGDPWAVRRRMRWAVAALAGSAALAAVVLAVLTTWGLVGVGAVAGAVPAVALAVRSSPRTRAGELARRRARVFRAGLEQAGDGTRPGLVPYQLALGLGGPRVGGLPGTPVDDSGTPPPWYLPVARDGSAAMSRPVHGIGGFAAASTRGGSWSGSGATAAGAGSGSYGAGVGAGAGGGGGGSW